MIHYQLQCSHSHAFDGWFRNSTAFEEQAASKLIECPACGDTAVERALMAPAVAKRESLPAPVSSRSPASSAEGDATAVIPTETPDQVSATHLPAKMLAVLQRMRAEVEKHCDYVGSSFADEARKIHHGEAEIRAIYGETTEEQAESLAEEGITVARMPWVPRADG